MGNKKYKWKNSGRNDRKKSVFKSADIKQAILKN